MFYGEVEVLVIPIYFMLSVKLILAKLYDEQNTLITRIYKFQIFSFSEDKNDLEDPDSHMIGLIYLQISPSKNVKYSKRKS